MMKFRVLFLCSSNADLSQMAEGFLRHLTSETACVKSAGIEARGLHPLAVQVMAEKGIDISHQRSKSVSELDSDIFDLVVTLCESAQEYCKTVIPSETNRDYHQKFKDLKPLFRGIPLILHWNIGDPVTTADGDQRTLAFMRDTRDQIEKLVEGLVQNGFIAALKEGRQRTERILDLLDEGILAHDGYRRISVFNRAAENITGYRREDVIGRDCHEVFHPSGLCGSQCVFIDGAAEELLRVERRMPFIAKDGTKKELKTIASTTGKDSNRPGYVVLSIQDITEIVQLRSEFKDKFSFQNMVGISKAMRSVFESIRQVSDSDYPVLITGESGTGKELVAHAIHNESHRKGAAFVPVNCGALPDLILESELFGHVRGAFTGATRDRKGRFELANGGTLFLDEVGELSASFQVKLLRVLQEMNFEKVGGEKSIQVDVRVLSATNRDIRRMVSEGAFREDLYYRLCVMPIVIPSLRERREDIPLLVEHALEKISKETGKLITNVEAETMEVLMGYSWPGNIRELINALRFSAIRCNGKEIMVHHLPPELQKSADQWEFSSSSSEGPSSDFRSQPPAREKLTVEKVKQALQETNGSKTKAAKVLGVGRATLYRFLDRHPLEGV